MTQTDLVPMGDLSVKTFSRHKSTMQKYADSFQAEAPGIPLHIALAAKRTDLSGSKRLAMLGTYESGEIVDISRFMHKIVRILGCTVYEHGPYTGADGTEKSGYFYVLIKTDKTTKREITVKRQVVDIQVPVIIKVSSQFLDPFFIGLISMDRPMDFTDPVSVLFTGSQSSGYHAFVVEDEEDLLATTIESMQHPEDQDWDR